MLDLSGEEVDSFEATLQEMIATGVLENEVIRWYQDLECFGASDIDALLEDLRELGFERLCYFHAGEGESFLETRMEQRLTPKKIMAVQADLEACAGRHGVAVYMCCLMTISEDDSEYA